MTLLSLSPLDGRYAAKLDALRPYFSELALQKYRVLVELRFLAALGDESGVKEVKKFSAAERKLCAKIVAEFNEKDGQRIKTIEKKTNHDVKAVEYFIREQLEKTQLRQGSAGQASWKNRLSFVHFSLTSEDVNNLAYGLMLRDAVKLVILPKLKEVERELRRRAKSWKATPMLSRTHGQSATPTTVGKEIWVFAERVQRQIDALKRQEFLGKLNGATGTFSAQLAAYPKLNWVTFSTKFVKGLGLTPNCATTQIEPHDYVAETAHTVKLADTILTDFSRDAWTYISMNFFKLKRKEGETGSSTMPHKVNPIDFENAEGNLGLANTLLGHLAEKLPISRMQRDLTDSTVLRNLGVAFGHAYLGWQSLLVGISKLELNKKALLADLNDHPEVLSEAIQTVLRRHGHADAYEKLKALTRGQKITKLLLDEFVKTTDLPAADKELLLELTPASYIGLAARLVK